MEDSSDDEEILLFTLATSLAMREAKKKRLLRRNRRWYVHPKSQLRFTERVYFNFIQQMNVIDENYFYKNFRMRADTFNELLALVGENLIHAGAHRSPILPPERLAITLILI